MPRKKELPFEDQTFFDPRSARQADAVRLFTKNDLIFLLGPAGTGKTHVAVYLAIKELTEWNTKARKRVEKIFITRPAVGAGKTIGLLPGELNEKMDPFMRPIYDIVGKLVRDSRKFLQENVEIATLEHMRGRTFEHAIAILDEAQNCTVDELTMFMTRLGNGGKLVISGDMDQPDIGSKSGLRPWMDALRDCPGIGFVEFLEADIVRHPLVRAILARRPKRESR